MARLIDADAFIKEQCESCDGNCDICGEEAARCMTCDRDFRCDFIQDLADAPTVDAVPVVRCKDCTYYHKSFSWCPIHKHYEVFKDDFCSRGKRREEAEL